MERRKLRYLVVLFCVSVSSLAWAQYLGPIGSPLPIQHRPTATTGVVRGQYPSSMSPFPSVSFPSAKHRSYSNNRTLFSQDNSLSMRVANYSKWRGVTRGLRF